MGITMIQLYYGYGKGKTTAAIGLALRSLGVGNRVVIVQFLKNSRTGEVEALGRFENAKVLRGSAGGFVWDMTPEQKALTKKIHDENLGLALEAARRGQAELVVLDEVIDAYTLGLLDTQPLMDALNNPPTGVELVLTGHSLPPEWEPLCDYITEMRKVKHPYDQGVAARKGVEF